jgi:broad specificity phosphatase PhoE
LCTQCKEREDIKPTPKRIILVRHGQSLGNVDEEVYCDLPDWRIPITTKGRSQAQEAARKIKELIGDEPVSFMCSPYLRTKQTLAAMMPEFSTNPVVGAREEPRLTEQQFGNYQDAESMKKCKKDRNSFGRFYYRFPNGESGLDVYNRVTLFIGTLYRDWERDPVKIRDTNIVLVTHGLTLRLFLMRWFQFTVQEFEDTKNPDNGSVVIMTRSDLQEPVTSRLLQKQPEMPDKKRAEHTNVEMITRKLDENDKKALHRSMKSSKCINSIKSSESLNGIESKLQAGEESSASSLCPTEGGSVFVDEDEVGAEDDWMANPLWKSSSSVGKASGYVVDSESLTNMHIYARHLQRAQLQTYINKRSSEISAHPLMERKNSAREMSIIGAAAREQSFQKGKSSVKFDDKLRVIEEVPPKIGDTGSESAPDHLTTEALTTEDTEVIDSAIALTCALDLKGESDPSSRPGVSPVHTPRKKFNRGIERMKSQRIAILTDLAGRLHHQP